MSNKIFKWIFSFTVILVGAFLIALLAFPLSRSTFVRAAELDGVSGGSPEYLSLTVSTNNSSAGCSGINGKMSVDTPFSWHCGPRKTNEACSTETIAGDKLKFIGAFVVFRHGARGPLTPVRHLSKINCNGKQSPGYRKYKTFLKKFLATKAFDKFEGPFVEFPALPRSTNCSPSDLTSLGASQLIAVGQLVSNRLSKATNTSRMSIVSFCTRYRRTVQSLWAFLYGFIGEENMEEATVSVQANKAVTYCEPYCKCDLASQHENKYSQMIGRLLSSSQKKDLKRIARILYGPQGSISVGARYVKDGLLTFVCHNLTLPCYTTDKNKQCVSDSDISLVQTHLVKESYATLDETVFAKMTFLKAYGLVKRIIQYGANLLAAYEAGKEPMFFVFSGHDLTLESLLSSLGIYNGMPPSFASNLLIEFYVNDMFETSLKFIFNDQDVTQVVIQCIDSPCLLGSFVVRFDSDFEKLFGSRDFQKACGNSS